MNKKLPKMYKNNISKNIKNNKTMDYVVSNKTVIDDKNIDINDSNIDVNKKINDLLESNRHLFNVSVVIKTKDREYKTRIAGKIRNYIVTLDNDIIFIKDILQIRKTDN